MAKPKEAPELAGAAAGGPPAEGGGLTVQKIKDAAAHLASHAIPPDTISPVVLSDLDRGIEEFAAVDVWARVQALRLAHEQRTASKPSRTIIIEAMEYAAYILDGRDPREPAPEEIEEAATETK